MRRRETVWIGGAALLLLLFGLPTLAFAQSTIFGDSDPSPTPVIRTYDVRVTSNVRSASVYVDGRYVGRSPVTIELREGSYLFSVEARGYGSWEERVTVRGDRTIRAELLPPTATVLLRIPSEFLNDTERDPWRLIDFYVDGRLRPESRVEVDPGWRTVTLVSGGLKIEREFLFEAGQVYTVEMFMRTDIFARSEF